MIAMMPDVEVLTKLLVPALPFLYKATDKVVDGALAKLGEDGWDIGK